MSYGARRHSKAKRRPSRYASVPRVRVSKAIPLARKSSVDTNRRMLERLKMSQYGSIQKCCVVATEILIPTSRKPLLMDLSDFTRETLAPEYDAANGGWIYTLDNAGALEQFAKWEVPPLAQVSSNPFMAFNNDIVDGGKYLALSNYMTFRVEGRPNVSNVRVRFQVFTQKMNAVYNTDSTATDFALPDALIHMKNLATFTSGVFLPKKFFNVKYDKTIFLNSSSVADEGQHGTTPNVKYVNIPWTPPGGKLVRQKFTAPINNVNSATLPEPDRGYFGPDVRNPGELEWLLISTDDSSLTTASIQITAKSLRCWRDAQGSY